MRLGEILIQEKKIDDAQLQAALAHQRRWGKKIGQCLVQLGFIQEIDLCQILAKSLRVPLIDVSKIDASKITKEVLGFVSVQIARAQRIVPIAVKEIHAKKRLVIATSDPTNYKTFDDIQFKSGLPVVVMISPDSDIDWFIRKYYLSESEALPLNYISGISIIDGDLTEGQAVPDPISNIFWDNDFTGLTGHKFTNAGQKPPSSGIARKDPKKDRKD